MELKAGLGSNRSLHITSVYIYERGALRGVNNHAGMDACFVTAQRATSNIEFALCRIVLILKTGNKYYLCLLVDINYLLDINSKSMYFVQIQMLIVLKKKIEYLLFEASSELQNLNPEYNRNLLL